MKLVARSITRTMIFLILDFFFLSDFSTVVIDTVEIEEEQWMPGVCSNTIFTVDLSFFVTSMRLPLRCDKWDRKFRCFLVACDDDDDNNNDCSICDDRNGKGDDIVSLVDATCVLVRGMSCGGDDNWSSSEEDGRLKESEAFVLISDMVSSVELLCDSNCGWNVSTVFQKNNDHRDFAFSDVMFRGGEDDVFKYELWFEAEFFSGRKLLKFDKVAFGFIAVIIFVFVKWLWANWANAVRESDGASEANEADEFWLKVEVTCFDCISGLDILWKSFCNSFIFWVRGSITWVSEVVFE